MPVNFNVNRARKLLPLVLFLLTGTSALAQTPPPSTYAPVLVTFNGVPSGPCDVYQVALNVTNGVFYTCAPLTRVWVLAASGLISTTNNWTGLNSFSQPITSTVATGTAPFSIASTTVVPNLNAALLNGATFASPGAIGGTTPGSGAFTTLSASGQFTSTVSTGTAPFSVASTTQVTNLNASQLGGLNPPASAIVGISDTQTLTAKTLTAPTITNPTITGGGSWAGSPALTTPTIDGTGAGHVATQVSAATNYGTALGSQTIIASMPFTASVSLSFLLVQVTAGVGCSAATNSVTVNPVTWTAPGGTVENINPSSNMGFTGNGVVDQGASTFGSSGFTNNGIQAIVAKTGTSISYTTTSTLASTGCTTTPQYQIYAKAIF